MSDQQTPADEQPLSLDLFQPHPDTLYSLDATAYLTGVSRRSILIYIRAGLLRPVFQRPYGMMVFTEETIYIVRRIEHVRHIHGIDVNLVKTMFDLIDEVERLRTEVHFLRKN